jgi:hypothetical protein
MVIPSFENAESPSPAALERGLFGQFPNAKVVLGLKKTSPVLFVAVESCGDGDDVTRPLGLETPFHLL